MYRAVDQDGTPSSFVEFVHIVSGKTATSPKFTAFVDYLVQAVLLNCSIIYRKWLIEKGFSFRVCVSTLFESTVEAHAESHLKYDSTHYCSPDSDKALPAAAVTLLKHRNPRRLETFLIHDSTSDLLEHLNAIEKTIFWARGSTARTLSYIPVLISYCQKFQK